MSSVKFSPEISLGGVVTILTLLVSIAAGWTVLSATVEANANRIVALERRADAVETAVSNQREQALQVQIDLARTLTELQSDMRYLRRSVDHLTQQSDKGEGGAK